MTSNKITKWAPNNKSEIEHVGAVLKGAGIVKSVPEGEYVAIHCASTGESIGQFLQEHWLIADKKTGHITPKVKAKVLQDRFIQSGGRIKWITVTDDEVRGLFSHPLCEDGLEVGLTIEDAKKRKFGNNWTYDTHPRIMLKNRVVTEAVEFICPGITGGMLTESDTDDSGSIAQICEAECVDAAVEPESSDDKEPLAEKSIVTKCLSWLLGNELDPVEIEKTIGRKSGKWTNNDIEKIRELKTTGIEAWKASF